MDSRDQLTDDLPVLFLSSVIKYKQPMKGKGQASLRREEPVGRLCLVLSVSVSPGHNKKTDAG